MAVLSHAMHDKINYDLNFTSYDDLRGQGLTDNQAVNLINQVRKEIANDKSKDY